MECLLSPEWDLSSFLKEVERPRLLHGSIKSLSKGLGYIFNLIFSVELLSTHNPRPFIPLIAPTPLLLTVAVDDTLTPSDIQLAAYNEAREPKQLQLVPGDHFAVYSGPIFERNAATQTEFLKKWLF